MFFRIHHRLSYTYDRPVFLEPMALRLTPARTAARGSSSTTCGWRSLRRG